MNSLIAITFKRKIKNNLLRNKIKKIKTMSNKLVQLRSYPKAGQNYSGKNHSKNFTIIYKFKTINKSHV